MLRSKPFASMQKTYDDCYLTCSTAIYFERQDNEAEALRSWRSALSQIYHHNAHNVPAGYVPKSETEKALQESLKEMELQCKERVDILDALEKSRKEAEKEAKRVAKETRAQRKATERQGSTPAMPTAGNTGWLGDLAAPAPPLPARPANLSSGSTESLMRQKSRGDAQPQVKGSNSTLPAPPILPVPKIQDSRSSSPDQRKTTMLTTLRKRDGKSKASSKTAMLKAPPASSKAAGAAWEQISRDSPSQSLSSRSQRASFESSIPAVTAARTRFDDARPVSDDDRRRKYMVGQPRPNPSDYLPSSTWREPQRPVASPSNSGDHPRQLNAQEPTQTSIANGNLKDTLPPPPAPCNLPAARRGELPDMPYRREYQTTTLKPGAAPIEVSRRPVQKEGSGNKSKKMTANTSTPRTARGKNFHSYISTSSGSEDNIRTKKSMRDPKQEGTSAMPRRKSAPRAATPPSSDDEDDSIPEEIEGSLQRVWELRCNAIMKDLPRGVDEQAARQILNDIVVQGDEVHWSDIAGLEGAKKALKEAVVYPFLRPDLFMGLREPARGMLLFGPPGTGKTMLARAVATESKSTFFAISASSLTSKWHGESEKLVRALFALAKKLAPSIIFVDEIDSLLSTRNSSSEHEASRRAKTEFLIQWSDLQRAAAGRDTTRDSKEGDASRVLVLAATNVPWDIDDAARRRFVRRQYIPLPEDETRRIQLLNLLSHQKHGLNDEDIEVLVQVTEGFSGSDITSLAKDAAMGPLRNLIEEHDHEVLLTTPMDQIRPIMFKDFEASLGNIRPSVSKEGLREFEEWGKEFGERGG